MSSDGSDQFSFYYFNICLLKALEKFVAELVFSFLQIPIISCIFCYVVLLHVPCMSPICSSTLLPTAKNSRVFVWYWEMFCNLFVHFPVANGTKTAGAYRNSKYRLNLNSQCTCSKAHMSSVYSIGHFNSITTKNEAAHKESKLHKCKAIDKSNVQRVKNLNWRKNKFPLNL